MTAPQRDWEWVVWILFWLGFVVFVPFSDHTNVRTPLAVWLCWREPRRHPWMGLNTSVPSALGPHSNCSSCGNGCSNCFPDWRFLWFGKAASGDETGCLSETTIPDLGDVCRGKAMRRIARRLSRSDWLDRAVASMTAHPSRPCRYIVGGKCVRSAYP